MAESCGAVNSIVSRRVLRHSVGMRLLFAVTAATVLGACAPLSIYYKPGVQVARLQTDTTQCEVAALKDAPVANEIRQHPPVYYPGRVFCDGAGVCHRGAPYWVDGAIYTVDVNKDLRRRVTDQCMADKGYWAAKIPPCPIGATIPAGRTTQLPALSPDSCAVKNRDGSFQIVDIR